MQRETELLFRAVMREDRSVIDFLDADFTFVDERLARHYGVPDIRGSRTRRVSLPADSPRRGLLGHSSVLTITSAANRTSPVVRGKWVLENLLGAPPPQPPPGVETNLEKDANQVKVTSLRQRLEQHRANAACASCHKLMDPIGLTLENFDHTGKWRTVDGQAAIDVSARLTDGTALSGPASLRQALLARADVFATVFVEKLLTYASGRAMRPEDMPAVRAIVRAPRRTATASRRSSRASWRRPSSRCGRSPRSQSGRRPRNGRATVMFITKKHLSRRAFLQGSGTIAGAAAPRIDGAGADTAPPDGRPAARAAGLHLRAARRHDGQVDAGDRRHRLHVHRDPEAARAVSASA